MFDRLLIVSFSSSLGLFQSDAYKNSLNLHFLYSQYRSQMLQLSLSFSVVVFVFKLLLRHISPNELPKIP